MDSESLMSFLGQQNHSPVDLKIHCIESQCFDSFINKLSGESQSKVLVCFIEATGDGNKLSSQL